MVKNIKEIRERLVLVKERYQQLEGYKKEMVEEMEKEITSLSHDIHNIIK